jgi:ubiquinone/menaquinone biosynthesis C-methylase UbiE
MATAGTSALQRYLSQVDDVFGIEAVLGMPASRAAVIDYYTQSRDLYRRVHSTSGAIHMALSEGSAFRTEGYYGQAQRVEQEIAERRPRRVLELGCGTGFNSAYLAARHPDVEFFALDITPAHLAEARERARTLPNLTLVRADFHDLPWAEQSFDLAFEVEAVCHVRDLPGALSGVFRVLTPGGRFLMFDGCRKSDFYSLPVNVQLAARLIEQAMAIRTDLVLGDFLQAITDSGFVLHEQDDITEATLPTILRLQRKAKLFFFWPWFARRLLQRDPALVNAIAVLLMPETIRAGAHVYLHSVLERPARAC